MYGDVSTTYELFLKIFKVTGDRATQQLVETLVHTIRSAVAANHSEPCDDFQSAVFNTRLAFRKPVCSGVFEYSNSESITCHY